MTLWQFSTREMKSRPARAALTLTSIVIGVAAVVSVAMAAITTQRAYKDMYQALTGRAAVEIMSETGDNFDSGIVDELAKRSDVRAAIPLVQKMTVLYHDVMRRDPKTGEPKKETEKIKVSVMGIDPERDKNARDYRLVSGDFFNGIDGALLESEYARSLHIKIGDKIRILASGGKELRPVLPVVGLLAPEGAASLRQGVLFLHLRNAQKIFGLKSKIDTIHLVPKDLAQSEEMLADVAKTLPPGLTARKPASRSQLSEETLDTPQQGLQLASAISVVVAGFIILNTFLMNVSERRRQLSILRAIGATRNQIMRLLIVEGVTFGLVGSFLGILLGLGGAFYLTRMIEQLLQQPLPALQITPLPFLLGAVMGLGISVAATIIPAYIASRVSPLEGMRPVSHGDLVGIPTWVAFLGLGLLVVASLLAAAFIKGLMLRTVPIIAAILTLMGCFFLIPVLLKPLSRLTTAVLRPFLRMEGELAGRQLLRRQVRTWLTTGVLFTALAMGIGLGTTFVNNINDVGSWFDRSVVGDFFVRATMPDMSSGVSVAVPESLREEIRAIPGVYQIASARFVSVTVRDQGAVLMARDFLDQKNLPLDIREGDPKEVLKRLHEGEIVVGTVLAHRLKLKVGETIDLKGPNGTKNFRIAGTANEYLGGGLALYIETATAKRELGIEGIDGFAVKCDRPSLFQVETKLREICDDNGLLLQSWADMRRMVDAKVNGIVGGLWVLLALGFVVAGFGIANTLTMNVLEQTREIGLLRIVAMTRSQVRKMVLSQAAIMGFIGLVPGALVGAGIAFLVSRAGEGEFGRSIEFKLQPAMFFGAFAAAYAIVLIAAWIPAQRAAKLKLTEALRYE